MNQSQRQLPTQDGKGIQNSQILLNLNNLIQKFKLIIKLHNDSQNMEVASLSHMSSVLIEHLVRVFKSIREQEQDKYANQIQSQIDTCNTTIKLFQIKIIDTVEALMKNEPNQNGHCQNAQSLYQQFYILCSEYMNQSYHHSNNICLLLSQEVHSMSPNHKSVPKPNPSTKDAHSADYFLLKHLFEKTCQAKKTYEQEVQAYEKQLQELRKQIVENKALITNLINEREELTEDLNQLEELIQSGSIQAAKQILNHRMQKKEWYEKLKGEGAQLKNLQQNKKINEVLGIEDQVVRVKNENKFLKEQIEALNGKLKEYKNQIYRAGWIISMQHRQISLNLQRIKQAEEICSKYTPTASNVSFNPGRNRRQSLQNTIKWPSPQSMFSNVQFQPKRADGHF